MAKISLKNVRKAYGDNVVIKNVDLDIEDKEFVVLLGGSGCGKSTLLRMIAGLESITGGEIRIGDTLANRLTPAKRDIAFVFQNYSLYPHMTVRQNMGFALENMGFARAEIDARVKEAATILKLGELLERRPSQLSGGQRQRVAIGRSIVRKPKAFLMDEPLSNLDANLRVAMRAEISRLHGQLETTFVYVTHDQVEAMTMAQRIVIIEGGSIQQVGTPLDVYDRPVNRFVAGFVGSPGMNFMDVSVDLGNGLVEGEGVRIPAEDDVRRRAANYDGKKLVLGVRPHCVRRASGGEAMFSGEVELVEPFGNETHAHVRLGGSVMTARLEPREKPAKGETLKLRAEPGALYFFDPDSGTALY